jgi:RNA polymerase sigma-70 factor (ECF subfamily)
MRDPVTDLACRARDGDDAAAAAFVRATQASVHRFVVSLSDRQVAEDLVQETYLRAFRALDTYAARSSALTWVLAIARRVCADHLRARGRRPVTRPLDDPDAVPASHALDDVASGVALDELIRSLDRDRHEAFVLTQLMGFSYQEAADVCGCPVGTIRSRVFRAREQLLAALADSGREDAGEARTV